MTQARRAGRIVVWPNSTIAAQAVAAESRVTGRNVVWSTVELAAANLEIDDEGGGEAYHADAVYFDVDEFLDTEALTVTDAATGFMSVWMKVAASGTGTLFTNSDSTIINYNGSGRIHLEFADVDYDNYIYLNTVNGDLPAGEWVHVLIAWDMAFAAGSRRYAVYINDVPTTATIDSDDVGVAFLVGFDVGGSSTRVLNNSNLGHDCAEFGLWVGPSIIGADSTISEVNRRKFIDAAGKPVDPSNWPASPVLKFSGDASTYATNQGTGGSFALTGTLTDAATSPSD